MKTLWLWPVAALAVISVAGCGRLASTTTLDADGGMTRSATFRLMDNGMGGDKPPMPENMLVLGQPAKWKVTKRKEESDQVLEAVRKLAPGEAAGVDFRVKDGGTGIARCEIKAVKMEDGQVEYTETWTWEGKKGTSLTDQIDAKAKASFEKRLKPLGATDAQVSSFIASMGRDLRKAILGPGEPLLGLLIADTTLATRKLRGLMLKTVEAEMAKTFPDFSEEKRKVESRGLVLDLSGELEQAKAKTAEAGPAQTPDSGQLVGMQLSVKGPGTVLETNGEVDAVDGQVYWNMYLEACEQEPVVLRAVFKP